MSELIKRIPLEDEMYKLEEHDGDDLRTYATSRPPLGPGFTDEEIASASKMEVWATTFNHASEFVDFYLIDAAGELTHVKRVMGY
jgi:hypothetical protein